MNPPRGTGSARTRGAFAVLALAWMTACGDGSTEPPPSRPPAVVGIAPDLELLPGETATLDASVYFRDPDGDPLSYEVRTSAPDILAADVSGSAVQLAALARGMATVTVTARDPRGRAAALRFGVTVPNRPPMTVGAISNLDLRVGDTARVVVSASFSDPDDDPLTYEATSSHRDVAAVRISGDTMRVAALGPGVATITVTARDPGGLSAELAFAIEVRARRGSFDIDMHFIGTVTERRRTAVLEAAEIWMSVLADTELPDVQVDERVECHGAGPTEPVGTIDDLMILVEFRDIDGPGRTLAQAGTCLLREGSMLPIVGVAFFDAADFDDLIDSNDATELAAHEIAHALGFGLLWRPLDLLRDPALGVGAIDAHFVGPLATAAFDAAGGTSYTGGAKVPVENLGGGGAANLHWRESVLGGELMRTLNRIGSPETFSAITIQSMADLGYTVDDSLAEPYTLPGAAADEKTGRVVDLGDDVLRGPLLVVDARGRIVRVLPDR